MSSAVSLDLRSLPPQERHLRVFSSFDALGADGTLELVNDHDPQPLRRQFDALVPNLFTWTAVESGPAAWRVRITKLARRDHCCGGCCGG